MKTICRAALFVGAASLSAAAAAQSARIEAEAGAVGFLQMAQQDYAKAKQAFVGRIGTNSSAAALAKLCRGEIAAAGTARPIAQAERAACAQANVQLVELPLGVDAIAIVANHQNTWAKQLSVAELRRAWLDTPGKAVSWKQLNAGWPERPIKLYGPTAKLGLAGHYGTALKAGAKETQRGDMTATEVLSIVVDGVAREPAALGVLDWATYSASAKRVRLVAVEIDGKVVQPNGRTLRDGSYGAFSYPVTLYVAKKALQDAPTKAFLEHALANGERLAGAAGLGALAAADYQQARNRLVSP